MNVRPGAIIIRDNRLLTLKYTYPGGIIYALPGGNLELGEELTTALARELREELGVQCAPGPMVYVAEVMYEGRNTIHFLFECLDLAGEPVINPMETKAEEMIWLPLAELHRYSLYPNVGRYLQDPQSPLFLGVIDQPRY